MFTIPAHIKHGSYINGTVVIKIGLLIVGVAIIGTQLAMDLSHLSYTAGPS
jgi:hypothetical protein